MDEEQHLVVRVVSPTEDDDGRADLARLNLLAHARRSQERADELSAWIRDAARRAAAKAMAASSDPEVVGDAVLEAVLTAMREGPPAD
ncbi:hypothetical protein [Microbacterium sp. CPCC 204701]|uniref:hypothetical protein n=1 Tax=Microbacterium sp. CPCC 204701 TaxID=2493084 RepID=UPI000FD6F712|nr:hypothetical protein [Microbacterium sp. CPCC 204701]